MPNVQIPKLMWNYTEMSEIIHSIEAAEWEDCSLQLTAITFDTVSTIQDSSRRLRLAKNSIIAVEHKTENGERAFKETAFWQIVERLICNCCQVCRYLSWLKITRRMLQIIHARIRMSWWFIGWMYYWCSGPFIFRSFEWSVFNVLFTLCSVHVYYQIILILRSCNIPFVW